MRNDQLGVYIDSDARCGCSRATSCTRCTASRSTDASCRTCGRHRRNTSCLATAASACTACGSQYNAPCAATSPCGHHRCESPCATCNRRTPAMVYAAGHTADDPYSCDQALARGTLFPCLDKPLCGEELCSGACVSEAQQLNFAAWELRLYLNTHPDDCQALRQLHMICQHMRENGYACAFLDDCMQGWTWIDGPWPWESGACCAGEG